eukprot:CAMPEP_0171986666 /NCGR_PEP_ID=MMETSP0993-20121228/274987_1 /TAXON_ID=483369 /ORGANISM="non described non described, Strain CCMP2098" /LENGTH=46 /DNA_ID= /DNA_START= /DNA_END= /DNA_ORIENTATION=
MSVSLSCSTTTTPFKLHALNWSTDVVIDARAASHKASAARALVIAQ